MSPAAYSDGLTPWSTFVDITETVPEPGRTRYTRTARCVPTHRSPRCSWRSHCQSGATEPSGVSNSREIDRAEDELGATSAQVPITWVRHRGCASRSLAYASSVSLSSRTELRCSQRCCHWADLGESGNPGELCLAFHVSHTFPRKRVPVPGSRLVGTSLARVVVWWLLYRLSAAGV